MSTSNKTKHPLYDLELTDEDMKNIQEEIQQELEKSKAM